VGSNRKHSGLKRSVSVLPNYWECALSSLELNPSYDRNRPEQSRYNNHSYQSYYALCVPVKRCHYLANRLSDYCALVRLVNRVILTGSKSQEFYKSHKFKCLTIPKAIFGTAKVIND